MYKILLQEILCLCTATVGEHEDLSSNVSEEDYSQIIDANISQQNMKNS